MTQHNCRIFLFRVLLPTLLLLSGITSCTQKMICPAYQSAFIYDTAALRKKFSYFKNDTPKIYEVNQNKFHLGVPMSYKRRLASFRTIEMLPIYPVIPDSLQFQGDEQMAAEMDVQDSTGVEEEHLHPGLIGPKFNVEQEMYMYYFRKILVLPDVRGEIAEREKVGFFKRIIRKIKGLFKRKKKKSAETDSTPQEDVSQEPKEKGGLFDKFKKKKQAESDSLTNVP